MTKGSKRSATDPGIAPGAAATIAAVEPDAPANA